MYGGRCMVHDLCWLKMYDVYCLIYVVYDDDDDNDGDDGIRVDIVPKSGLL